MFSDKYLASYNYLSAIIALRPDLLSVITPLENGSFKRGRGMLQVWE